MHLDLTHISCLVRPSTPGSGSTDNSCQPNQNNIPGSAYGSKHTSKSNQIFLGPRPTKSTYKCLRYRWWSQNLHPTQFVHVINRQERRFCYIWKSPSYTNFAFRHLIASNVWNQWQNSHTFWLNILTFFIGTDQGPVTWKTNCITIFFKLF